MEVKIFQIHRHSLKLTLCIQLKNFDWVAQPTNFKKQEYSFTRAGQQHFNYTDLWDYSDFTGTPDGSLTTGMRGRYNHNFYGGFTSARKWLLEFK